MVPVIRNAENLSFRGVEAEVKRLAIRAREGQITVDEMTGGTFTITNGGVFGSMLSTPIINPPQSAILGMHNVVDRAIVRNGQIVVAPVMYIALSYDHRLIDGRESVGFLVEVKKALENPVELLMNNDLKLLNFNNCFLHHSKRLPQWGSLFTFLMTKRSIILFLLENIVRSKFSCDFLTFI